MIRLPLFLIHFKKCTKLKDKEDECTKNASKIAKINLEQFKSNELATWKHSFRMPDLKQEELNDLLAKMKEKLNEIENETKKYKDDLLMNEAIFFDKYEKSSSFGSISFYPNNLNVLSKNCGKLIKRVGNHFNCKKINSIQVDEISKKLFSSSDDKTIKIWNLETGECLETLENHAPHVQSILLLPNINKFISASTNKEIKIWDFNSYECLNTLENESGVCSLYLVSDNQIACGCLNGFIVIWNLDNSTKVKTFKAHNSWITYLIVNTNKSKLISCSVDCKIKIWNLEIFECIKLLEGHSDVVNYLELTLDGNLLSCSVDMTIKLWQTETGK